jgi:hypothetical protein
MTQPVTITTAPPAQGRDIGFIDDIDALAWAETMLRRSHDNPYLRPARSEGGPKDASLPRGLVIAGCRA